MPSFIQFANKTMDTPELEDVGIISPFFKLFFCKINFSSCLKIGSEKVNLQIGHICEDTCAYNSSHYLRNKAAA